MCVEGRIAKFAPLKKIHCFAKTMVCSTTIVLEVVKWLQKEGGYRDTVPWKSMDTHITKPM